MRVFVTGGTGFIGSHLVELLVNRGNHVTCLTRKTSDLRWLKHLLEKKSPQIEVVTGHLNDAQLLIPVLKNVEVVFHLAGLTKAPNAETYNRVNAEGTRALIEACLSAKTHLTRFVYCSSLAAVGPSGDGIPMTEEIPPKPLTDYGKSKLKGEEIVREYADVLPSTIVRPPAVYGPRDLDVFIFFQLIHKGVMPIIGDETRRLSFVHAKDLVAGIYAATLADSAVGETYFLTDGHVHSWLDISQTIATALQKRPLKVKIPLFVLDTAATVAEVASKITHKTPALNRQKTKDLKQKYWICDSTKAEQQIGYRPIYPLEVGIRDTARWYIDNKWLK